MRVCAELMAQLGIECDTGGGGRNISTPINTAIVRRDGGSEAGADAGNDAGDGGGAGGSRGPGTSTTAGAYTSPLPIRGG